MFQELNTHPNFQIYFTMSFPDMDFVNGYFYEGLALYIKNSDVQKSLSVRRNPYTKILSSPLEKNIYHYTLYIWMSYIKNNHAGVKQMGQLLYGKDHLLPQCVEDLSEVTGTYTRYLTARILYYHVSGLWDKRQESVDSLIAYLHNSVGKCVGDHHLMFITTMACDALLLTGQSMDCLGYFLKMEPLRKCAFMEYEPSGTRFLHYGRNYNESLLVKTEYENCVFNNCNFSNYNLSDFIFEDCTFHICNLSMAKFSNTALRNVTFRDCKISGVRFDVCKPFGLSFSFAGCQLSHASFFKLSMKNAKFTNSIFHGTDFAQADLTGAVFVNCDLTDALFDQTIPEKADFRSSYNYSIHPEKNRINKARFSASGISGLLKHYHIIIED